MKPEEAKSIHLQKHNFNSIFLLTGFKLKTSDVGSNCSTKLTNNGGSHGLVVTGGDSCFKGCGFESQRHILDG